jgi:hypothetical protein
MGHDEKFFRDNPDRTYRVRPAEPQEVLELKGQNVVDEDRHQPAVVVKFWRQNGYELLARILVGAPKGINLYTVSEETARKVFEPAS